MKKYTVTLIDKHGDTDVIDVYAKTLTDVPFVVDSDYGDDYLAIVDISTV